jgi:uncharacterized protein (TIGR00297 family)
MSEIAQPAVEDKPAAKGRYSDALALAAAIILLAFFMTREYRLEAPGSGKSMTLALLVSAIFAICAWLVRAVDLGGAFTGAVIAFIFVSRGWQVFALLLALFGMTFLATRFCVAAKEPKGRSQDASGRAASQVIANLLVAAACLAVREAGPAMVAAAIAALAEAAADTVSSEIGEPSSARAYLVTSLRKVPAGTNGAITLWGSLSGIGAATWMAVLAWMLHLVTPAVAGVVGLCGSAGMFFDSFLGATLERRGWLTNDWVNLLGTAATAGAALLFVR